MSFIGNVPAEAYSTVAKDTFSGNGSTTDFTLSLSATTNGVEVFVENVQQEPTTAYTISGTTLTFTAAPVTGTNNIYVIHRGPAVQQIVPPAGVAIDASTVTASSTISATGDISTEGDLKVEVTSGGIYTITGTDTASNRTLTLPDEAGTVLTSAATVSSVPAMIKEGTWTPSADFTTPATAGSTTGTGHWQRIGNYVTLFFYISDIDTTGASGQLRVTGFPYTPVNYNGVTQTYGTAYFNTLNVAGGSAYDATSEIDVGTASLRFRTNEDNATASVRDASHFVDDQTDVRGTVTYYTTDAF